MNIFLKYLFLLPLIHFFILYFISLRKKQLKKFFNSYAIAYLDWFFVPFNFFVPLAVIFSWKKFLVILIISFLITFILHKKWFNNDIEKKQTSILINKKKLTFEGKIHFLFMLFQAGIVGTVLLSKGTSINYVFMNLFLILYILGYFAVVKYIRNYEFIKKPEIPLLVLGLIIIIIRIIIYFIYSF